MPSSNESKNKIFTIPNLLSLFRLCLIPVIIWLYCEKENFLWTTIVLILSGVTDIVDGYIARHFNMVSDFGKAFDPVADKLTQIAMLFCLLSRFQYMIIPLVLLVVKEISTAVTGLISIKKTKVVEGAVWHGKITTVSLYSMMAIHLIWYNIPYAVSFILIGICIGVMLMSFIMYFSHNVKSIKNSDNKKRNS